MSSSDPASNFDSLNLSSEPMDIPAAVGEAPSQRSNRSASSTPRRARSKSLQGQGQGRRNMSQVIRSMPKVHDSGRHLLLLFQLVVELVQNPNHRSCLRIFLPLDPRLLFTTPSNIMISDPSASQGWSRSHGFLK